MNTTPTDTPAHPDPRWINGERIVDVGMTDYLGANKKPVCYRIGLIVPKYATLPERDR